MYELYTGQLDGIDPSEYGRQLQRENKDCFHEDYNLTYNYYSDDPNLDLFLTNWYNKMVKAWRFELKIMCNENYLEKLDEFKKNLPNINEYYYFNLSGDMKNYFKGKVICISDQKDSFVIDISDNEKSELKICGYGFSPFNRLGDFINFKKDLQNG